MKNIKIFLIDDHQLIIDGIKALLNDVEDISIVGEARTGREAMEKLKNCSPDIVFVDIDMPVMNGYETTLKILKKYNNIKVAALTMFNEKALINQMLKAGASGYILKNTGKNEIIEAIYKIAEGKLYLSPEIQITMLRPIPLEVQENSDNIRISVLTEREIQILTMIAQGFSNSKIGKKLFISKRTVDTHRNNLMKKLQIHNISGLIKYAIKNGLI